jgi:hypothetical protein
MCSGFISEIFDHERGGECDAWIWWRRGEHDRMGSARDEKAHTEWREWPIQIFEIWIGHSEDEGRCLLLPDHPPVTWR